ncbi:helix-turn-helix transcriptional regulator [Weissella diestrammenae]|uniref:Helix-turn-helix transcriptional regulator n=1 Tax=Weissella diestrammenae TaxID=1162633 RepID=A0A7G9T405_9LACO|nr:PadR family transcriptional regulator [Weissella diestrammenae]MCM0583027.1 helix-turn-helix transcriptional regulator [Weissella diestrammenae]QNN74830.1 helix-turn-helix transcriptional regulator [Weissella diestrammenae]
MANELSKDLIRGHTDAIVLNLLSQGDSYGYRIVQDIKQRTKGQYTLNEATLYTVFRRLGKAGLVESYYGDESQGGRRKYYSLTPLGQERLTAEKEAWAFARQMINELMGDKDE